MESLHQEISKEFRKRFHTDFIFIKSPGRVNLIGEHTDYNQGFVLPAAIDKSIFLAIGTNDSGMGRFYALDKGEYFEADISNGISSSDKDWPDYILGVVDQLHKRGYNINGLDCVFGGNVPIGAGMSSSAALEGGVLYGLTKLYELDISPLEMARIAQQAENDFVGVQCGIMDQFASLNGKKDHAIKLDCRSLEYEYYPFNRRDVQIVLCDTRVRRELATSEYNLRRSQCEQGVEQLQEFDPDIESLRDVDLEFLMSHETDLDPTIFRRCKYIVEENKRVLLACRDLENDDFASFGRRMYQSHLGLRYEYEVSCPELDALVDIAREMDGVIGCRMMGGGFGGCTINLVEEKKLDSFESKIQEQYYKKMGTEIVVYKTKVSEGTSLLNSKVKTG